MSKFSAVSAFKEEQATVEKIGDLFEALDLHLATLIPAGKHREQATKYLESACASAVRAVRGVTRQRKSGSPSELAGTAATN